MLQLRHGGEHPAVRRRSTREALAALREEGLLPAGEADDLLRHYDFLRRLEARLRLERDRPVEELGTDPAALAPLAVRLGYGGDRPGDDLLRDYHRTREAVRALFDAHFAATEQERR
jgi:[glutamine synthetase] adenylyltransferase / [glutamine synthetase]-adenylyl-L-tyrosine phosphorylase